MIWTAADVPYDLGQRNQKDTFYGLFHKDLCFEFTRFVKSYHAYEMSATMAPTCIGPLGTVVANDVEEELSSKTERVKESSQEEEEETFQKYLTAGDDGEPKKPWIGYRIEYRNRWTSDLIAEKVPDKESEPVIDQNDGPIFEVVTTYKVVSQSLDANTSLAVNSQSLPIQSLRIHSLALINALQSVVKYYPDQDLSGEYISIRKPYPILVHHYDELQQFRLDCLSKLESDLCAREKDAAEHLRILLQFLDDHVMAGVREEQERNKRGFSTFEWRWVALKPGVTFLERDEQLYEGWEAFVIHSVTGGVFENPPVAWEARKWRLNYEDHYIERVWGPATTWVAFDGEKPDATRTEEVRFIDPNSDECMKDGIKKLPTQGKGSGFPTQRDVDSYHSQFRDQTPVTIGDEGVRNWVSGCTCNVCQKSRSEGNQKRDVKTAFSDFLFIVTSNTLSNHQYLLFPTSVVAYMFRTRSWERVHIKNLSEAEFDENMISHLVMSEHRLKTLKALSKSFARVSRDGKPLHNERWSADFIRGKGSGLIFLLHGKPGVGKTYTAECIAEFAKRPLMILTSSDIGTDPKEVEYNLTASFKRAMTWGAVLLIDEADIFMERRTTSDLTRNSLVAGFLRALEFYDGILFLTTNRVGSFDDAFISRIHVQLYYPDFTDDERQKVWRTFIAKLARERGETIRLTIDAKEYIEATQKHGIKWNGREIRNAFQTAVALAEYDAEKDSEGKIMVKDYHLKAVIELSKDFKGYLDDLHRRDEGKRAEHRYERLDSYDGGK
ncbi:ATPase [Colletotrichum karsti]|uniref:ATPase n=1 Tax=Colletotrichum karsti TaxID=1095194 RepID=A0A9P6LF14_9PEZI|nr:ATPase [Colletotrichum karsti]KAF9871018.1 ATPase [Colletotrichum karsti]